MHFNTIYFSLLTIKQFFLIFVPNSILKTLSLQGFINSQNKFRSLKKNQNNIEYRIKIISFLYI